MLNREEQSTSFGRAAGRYEAGRPEYPVGAVEWMLAPVLAGESSRSGGSVARVADVGAGTGKLTRAIAALGADVVAIDPDPDMLVALAEAAPGTPTFVGTGEALPLPDSSVDAVVFGQAWHWVDPDVASAEAARVLRPGGVVGLVWNLRDESTPWVKDLTQIMRGSNAEELISNGGPRVAAPFGTLESREWSWNRPLTRGVFLDMVGSRSYVITAGEEERAAILAAAGAVFDEQASGGTVVLPYRTIAYRARLADSADEG